MNMFDTTEQEREHQQHAGQAALDWQKLYSWTKAHPANTVLGQSCTNALDPLCTYLGAVTGTRAEVWSVGPSIKTGYGDRLSKPAWVKQLIEETDRETGNQSRPVTREMYLIILERVKPSDV